MRLFITCASGWQGVTVFTEARKVPTHGSLELEGKGAGVTWNMGEFWGTSEKAVCVHTHLESSGGWWW